MKNQSPCVNLLYNDETNVYFKHSKVLLKCLGDFVIFYKLVKIMLRYEGENLTFRPSLIKMLWLL